MLEGGEQVVHHLLHLSLGGRREIFRDIDFADGVAEIGVDVCDGALPTVELFGCSLKRLIIEAESQIVVGLREKGGVLADGVEGEPFLPCVERLAADEGR